MIEDKRFGAAIGRAPSGAFASGTIETQDGVTHRAAIIDHSHRWLRYVLAHDDREYLATTSTVRLVANKPITCVICMSKGDADAPATSTIPAVGVTT